MAVQAESWRPQVHAFDRLNIGGPELTGFITSLFGKERKPETIRMQWDKKRYAEVETGITRDGVADAVDALRAFRELPDETKQAMGRGTRGKDTLGFKETNTENDENERRLGKEPEHKAYVHYHPSVRTIFAEAIGAAGPTAATLMEKLHALWVQTEAIAFRTVERIEAEHAGNPAYTGFTKRIFPDGLTRGEPGLKHPNLKLRLMLYFKVDEGKLSANNHFDAGMLAFALMESNPGLQVGTREKKDADGTIIQPEVMEEIHRPDGTALCWPGTNYKNVDPSIEGTWHGVRQHTTDDVALGEENRWVLVAFLDEYEERIPPIEETHGLT